MRGARAKLPFLGRGYSLGMDTTQKSAGDFWITLGSPLLTNTGGRPIPTDAQLMLEYLTNDLVYTCANWNAASVARVQFRLYARRDSPGCSHGALVVRRGRAGSESTAF